MNKLQPFKLTKENFFVDKYWSKSQFCISTHYIFTTKREAEVTQERILDNQQMREKLEKLYRQLQNNYRGTETTQIAVIRTMIANILKENILPDITQKMSAGNDDK